MVRKVTEDEKREAWIGKEGKDMRLKITTEDMDAMTDDIQEEREEEYQEREKETGFPLDEIRQSDYEYLYGSLSQYYNRLPTNQSRDEEAQVYYDSELEAVLWIND